MVELSMAAKLSRSEASAQAAGKAYLRPAAANPLDWPLPSPQWKGGWTALERRSATPPVHVWAVCLDVAPTVQAQLVRLLSAAESQRAARYHFQLHRKRFIAGRGLLRLLLGRYLNCSPADLDFVYGPSGKPALAPAVVGEPLEFNLAHSEHLALIAVSRGAPLGVDIEKVRSLPEAHDLVRRFFSPREAALFAQLPDPQKEAAFFNLWTRKEAWLKGTGEGIARYLAQVEVAFLSDEPAELLSLPATLARGQHWRLYNLVPAAGFAAALAVAGPHTLPACHQYPPAIISPAEGEQSSYG